MASRPDLSVIVPAYNEEQRIAPTLIELYTFLENGTLSYEILVVDDGSSDGTVALVERMREERPALRCIASRPNRGKGFAVRRGMFEARGKVRVMCDADGSIPAEQLPLVVEPVWSGAADIAIGSRYVPGAHVSVRQPIYRVWWSRLCNLVIQRVLVPGVRDTQCGFKAFSAPSARFLFSRAKIDGWAFDLELLALARRVGYRICETGVSWSDDARSRIHPLRDAVRVVREMLTIRRNLRRGAYLLCSAPSAHLGE